MEAAVLAFAAGVISSVAAVVRAVGKDVAGACTAAALALISFAAFIGNL